MAYILLKPPVPYFKIKGPNGVETVEYASICNDYTMPYVQTNGSLVHYKSSYWGGRYVLSQLRYLYPALSVNGSFYLWYFTGKETYQYTSCPDIPDNSSWSASYWGTIGEMAITMQSPYPGFSDAMAGSTIRIPVEFIKKFNDGNFVCDAEMIGETTTPVIVYLNVEAYLLDNERYGSKDYDFERKASEEERAGLYRWCAVRNGQKYENAAPYAIGNPVHGITSGKLKEKFAGGFWIGGNGGYSNISGVTEDGKLIGTVSFRQTNIQLEVDSPLIYQAFQNANAAGTKFEIPWLQNGVQYFVGLSPADFASIEALQQLKGPVYAFSGYINSDFGNMKTTWTGVNLKDGGASGETLITDYVGHTLRSYHNWESTPGKSPVYLANIQQFKV